MTNEKQDSLTQYKEKLLGIEESIDLNVTINKKDERDEIDEALSNMDMKKI